jgi:hypothetical protein
MNTTKHTPGPWHLSECATQTTKAGIVSIDGLHITDVNGYGMTDSQNQVNAHLIAAAPAMYEALVETMRVLRSLRDNKEEWYTLVTPELLTAWDKNKTALAQAEGSKP